MKYITRIAPSPTGMMHIGTCRTAYINYLAAKSSGGTFILRIDDTDIQRNKKEYTDIIFQSLEWLGLKPDKVEYQSKREHLYISEAKNLLFHNKAVELDNGAVALLYPYSMPKLFNDDIAGDIAITETNKEQIDRKTILLRGYQQEKPELLGKPTYQLASIIDDYFMGINYIIRGVDHITNTPKQLAIWMALNEVYGNVQCPKPFPKFAHLGLITQNNKKLSKRDGASSLMDYKEKGYTAEVMLDWLIRMGWSLNIPRGPEAKEMNKLFSQFIPKQKAIEWFFEGKLKNSPCALDIDKLDNRQKEINKRLP